ncbi:MAG TPA: phosphoribosylformylglycinamidine synthase subunit PurL [Candidatus Acidoferrales bacterium]|jgi:phosphoribosylformylglycinamidine synthase|nr:phosphoribosylformylglycinamidine synthase subunit PurL [Candidatus Acidoferrales bacterium]
MIEAEIKVTPQIAAEHGLTSDEYARIQKILGRDPNLTELGIFSVMWSEHCSYKSSRVHLKKLPTRGTHVVQGPGENAGVVDIGDGLVAVFKIESHNHPSFVEPFQGAATGVGGILRDIFTMGARPIAVLDSLRFGPITAEEGDNSRFLAASRARENRAEDKDARDSARNDSSRDATAEEIARNRRILDGVIRGIGFYGNCFGVPTVGGEVIFEPCYSNNPLVNALALGIARREELFFAKASGVGNPVIYVGAKTGRDGIHGASLLASAEFSEESQQKRPNVQVGDPFMEKLLLEACLEAMRTGAVVAIQDMGAAGLTSSSAEMASRGGLGIEIDLARVPQRETNMTAYDIMLSESQERMLLVAERGREREVFEVFHKWGLDAVEVGRVTDDGKLRVLNHGKVAADIPAHALAEEGPRYERPIAAPAAARTMAEGPAVKFASDGADLTENFRRLLASPDIASKEWITEQYDSMVRTNTRLGPGSGDAAVLRLKETKRALAIKTDGNGRWGFLSPRLGAMHAVAEAARNVACTGARPIAATNCLNFGNPEKPEVMWQFTEAIDGIAEACRVLETPITGGNVSFYNETLGKPIYPTPILGVLGLMEDAECAVDSAFKNEGDIILVLDGGGRAEEQSRFLPASAAHETCGQDKGAADFGRNDSSHPTSGGEKEAGLKAAATTAFGSSEYAKEIYGVVAGAPPAIDLAAEKRLIECLVRLASEKAIVSAHDVSDGGLAVTLAESCFDGGGLSADVDASAAATGEASEIALFGERGARAVVSTPIGSLARLEAIAAECGVQALRIGTVSRGEFRIQYKGATVVRDAIESFRRAWTGSLEKAVEAA